MGPWVTVALPDADRLAQRDGRYTEFRGNVLARGDDQFGAGDVRADARRDQHVDALHLFDQLGSGFVEKFRIRPGKHDGHIAARPEPTRLRREPDARIRNLRKGRGQGTLKLNGGTLTVGAQRDVNRRLSFAYALKRPVDFLLPCFRNLQL